MARIILLSAGILLLLAQFTPFKLSQDVQLIIFFTGIILLGIPHGAADLLVASKNAINGRKKFSVPLFFLNYLGRLTLFAFSFYFFPLAANIVFIIMAAYHFGETDLHQFNTQTLRGSIFVTSYGVLILGVILLVHFEEVMPLFMQFETGQKYTWLLEMIDINRYSILSLLGILFFITAFLYFVGNNSPDQLNGRFLVHLAMLLFILFKMPMMLGFTFYFICWHSILSLQKIINYLNTDRLIPKGGIIRQIIFYSAIAIGGIIIMAIAGTAMINTDLMVVYVFIGLAVLTAPHMQIMQEMYRQIRAGRR
jgi:Brp/Blh family beta-carotene 15,15'-monooxygenase